MNKMIEETAWKFASKQWGKQVPHTIDKIADMLIDFSNEIKALPLSDRLTDEEIKKITNHYNMAKSNFKPVYAEACQYEQGAMDVLESIFGEEMFNEKEK